MKKNTILGKLVVLAMALMIFGTGCSVQGKSLRGEWVDVNSNIRLEIGLCRLKFVYPDLEFAYWYRIDRHDGMIQLRNIGRNEQFGITSPLQLNDDGSLTAYEVLLDGPTTSYRFVKENQLSEAKKLIDNSIDLPKEINSTEIEEFSLNFDHNGASYDISEDWPSGHYSWTIEKQEDGTFKMCFQVLGESYVVMSYVETVDAAYVKGLAELLKAENIAENNGYSKENKESKPGYHLHVKYASDEILSIHAYGGAADTCLFRLTPLLDYAAKQELPFEQE